MFPSVDHSLLSPSGRVSKRARAAALKREGNRLFPPGYFAEIEAQHQAHLEAGKAARLRARAADLKRMAEAGMCRRKFLAEAARLEAEAEALA